MTAPRRIAPLLAAPLLAATLLAGCGGGRLVSNDEYGTDNQRERILRETGGRATNSGLVVFGVDRSRDERASAGGGGNGMTVNAFLWRATLDTLRAFPLASADPFGGVVITDWYSPPEAQGERFKVTAYVTTRQLRSDGVRVQVFRQVLRGSQWVDAPASASTNAEMEDRVLATARELRSAQTASR